MIQKIRQQLSLKIIANLISFGVMGVCGLLFNIFIGRFFGVSALGVFNQIWAIYILLSQLSVWGVHLSLLRQSSVSTTVTESGKVQLMAGVILIFIISSTVGIVGVFLSPFLEIFYSSKAIGDSWPYAIPGMVLFAVNKGLLAIVNGSNRMIWFAMAQAARYLLLLFSVFVLYFLKVPGEKVSICFSIAEIGVLLVLLPSFRIFLGKYTFRALKGAMRAHLQFGTKTLLGGAFIELNSKIDVLVLGLFTSDMNVGIYSFAATLVEGVSQLAVVFRNLINPKIAILAMQGQGGEILRLGKRYFLPSVSFYALVSLVLFFFFPYIVRYLAGQEEFIQGQTPLLILLIGLTLASPFMPFFQVFTQSNRPGAYTIFQGIITLTTLSFTLMLVPLLGILGAALGVSLSLGLSGIWLLLVAKKILLFESRPLIG